jgi:hypothetical protein
MLEKIKSGYYSARLIKCRLCDVLIWVWNSEEPGTREQIEYSEYEEIKHLLK